MSYDITDDLERARNDQVIRLRHERDAARAEVVRLTDGIREHRHRIGEAIAEYGAPSRPSDERLWSLLDVAGDDSHVPTADDFPHCGPCHEWREAGASWPRPCSKHYGGEL